MGKPGKYEPITTKPRIGDTVVDTARPSADPLPLWGSAAQELLMVLLHQDWRRKYREGWRIMARKAARKGRNV